MFRNVLKCHVTNKTCVSATHGGVQKRKPPHVKQYLLQNRDENKKNSVSKSVTRALC